MNPRSKSGVRKDRKKLKQVSKSKTEIRKNGILSNEIDAILQVLPDIFFVIDLKGRIVKWNRSGELITGFDTSEILDQPVLKFFPESEHNAITEAIRQSLTRGTHRIETLMQRKNGSTFPCQIRGSVLKDDKGSPVGITGIIRDMSDLQSNREHVREKEQAEFELSRSEEKFRHLAEQTNALIFTTDVRGRITFANDATSKALGVPVEELLGTFYLDFVHKDERKKVHERLLKQMREQSPGTMTEIRFLKTRDGRSGWLNIVTDPVVENGAVTGMKGLAIDVTEQKEWQLALKISEENHRHIVDHAPIGIYQSTVEGKFLDVNAALVEMLEYDSVDEVKNLDLSKDVYYDPRDRSKAIQQFLADGMKGDVELQWKKRSGAPFWVVVSTHAVLDEHGNVKYFEGFVRDITEGKNAELELLRNEEYYRSLIENSVDVTLLVDRNGTVSYVSTSIRNVLGFNSLDMVRQPFLSLFHPDDQHVTEAVFRKLRATAHETAQVEVRVKHKDGRWRFVEATGHNMLHNPAVQGIVLNFHDVTDRLEAEGKLKDSEHKYRQLVEQASDGIFIGDSHGCFTLVNEKGCQMLGYSEAELVGMPVAETYEPEEREKTEERQQLLQSRGSLQFERTMRRKDGSVFSAEINIKRLSDGQFQGIVRDVTERNRAEAALRESEEKFRLLAEESPNMIFINKGGKVVYANRRCEEVMEYSREEFYSDDFDFRTLIHRESREIVERNFRAHHEGKDIPPYEYALISKNGRTIFGLHSTRVISYEGGKAILGIITDVTETRQAEETQRKLLAAVEQSHDVVFMTDVQGNITFVNPAFEKTYGYSRKEILGKTPRVLKSGIYNEKYYSRFWATLLNRDSIRGELINKRKDGRLLTMEVSVNPVLNSQGELLGFLSVQTDVTERKKTEQIVDEQATLLDIATDGILVINPEGKVTYWNKGAERMYGTDRNEVLGKPLTSAIGVSPTENFEAFRTTLEKGAWEGEMTNITRDQRSITVQSRWTLLRGDSEKPRSILVVNSDVTEKKVLQKQFYRSQRLDSLGTLAGGIAHDLNNVLAPILLSFEVLSRHIKEESGKKMLKTAQESANRGKQIVSQVLSFARGIEGKKGAIQVRHLLDEIANIIRETFPKSIEIHTDIPKDLWTISADAGQMHQVMMNLVVNARDAMPQGGKLTLAARNAELDEQFCRTQLKAHPGRYVVLSAEDTGVGIPANILDRIFDPFFTTKEMGKGTGLGLSTVHTIVSSHDGFVDVTSTSGKGTTFKIYVPTALGESEEQNSENTAESTMAHGEWILVIDDEKPILDITEQVLVARGYNVMTAADGVEAVALFAERSGRFDLVVTDLMMPMMDGIATIRALRRIRPEIKIIAMSGMLTDDSARQAKDLSPESFLSKPFTSDKLLQTIGEVLKKT